MQHLHDRQAGVEPNEVGEFKWTHWVMRAEPHGGIDRLDVTHAFIQGVDGLVDHRQQMRLTMKAGKSSDTAICLPSLMTNSLAVSNVASPVAMPRMSSTNSISGTGFMNECG